MGNIIELIHEIFALLFPAFHLLGVGAISHEIFLLIISGAFGCFAVWIYGRVSNQKKISAIKKEIYANLLESVLFNHNSRISLLAQAKMFAGGLKYFLLAVPPLLVLLIPALFLMAQINLRYEYAPLDLGDRARVLLEVDTKQKLDTYRVEVVGNLDVTPPVRIEKDHGIVWGVTPLKVREAKRGEQEMLVIFNDAANARMEIPIAVGKVGDNARFPVDPIYPGAFSDVWSSLLFPSDAFSLAGGKNSLESIGAKSVEINYSKQELSILGISTHWLVVFFLVSLIAGLVFAKIKGIEV